jgi:phosphatidylglycerol lysyltransferase
VTTPRPESAYGRLRAALPALVGLALFLAALEVLRSELGTVTWQGVVHDILSTPPSRLAETIALAALSYGVLTGYDFLAFAYLGKHLPWRRVATASFLAYAIGNNVGFAGLAGASVRYRFYTRWGVSAADLSRIVLSYLVTFWVGLLLVGGLSLALSPLPTELGLSAPEFVRPIGWALVMMSAGYLVVALLRVGPIRIRQVEIALPPPTIAVAQVAISIVDWLTAGAVLYALLPAGRVPFLAFIGAFLASQMLGLVSHVPGGLGVFEGLMVLLLQPFAPSAAVLPALIVYRAVYYLLPLSIALLILVADEIHQRRSQAARLTAALGWLTEQLTPRLLSAFTFMAGVILLLSGATPEAAERLRLLYRVLPLGVIEASHFLGSIVGAALLLLSQGLARRLDAAYFLTVVAMAVGIVASLLKGGDYAEATILAAILLVLWRARPAFDRRAALFDTRFSPGWIAAIAGALGASLWIGLFAFRHVEYSNELWWQFELQGEASRVLRASVGAAVTLLLFAVARLLRHAPPEVVEPTDADLDAAGAIIGRQLSTSPYLAYLRDKALLFDEPRSGFVMYGVQGSTWVALGDPVGPIERIPALIQLFLERCDDFGGVPVFYQIASEHLHHYVDVGLTFVKVGEEARVDLQSFSIEGAHGRPFRQALHHLERAQATFRIVQPPDVSAVMDQLQAVSDEWQQQLAAAEKGFSLGFFRPDYIARFPVAVIETAGRVVAFANLWPGPQGVELSADLMRFTREAPRDVMEALFVQAMLWGRDEGYRWFSLGMAPLSGIEGAATAPLWYRFASFVYEHGEAVYNFHGLREYKEKFNPVWQPRYLAYPGGLHLPRVVADVSALIAGGYRRIFLK